MFQRKKEQRKWGEVIKKEKRKMNFYKTEGHKSLDCKGSLNIQHNK